MFSVSTELKGMECRPLLSGSSRQQSAELSSPPALHGGFTALPQQLAGIFLLVKFAAAMASSCIVIFQTKDLSNVTRVAPDQM